MLRSRFIDQQWSMNSVQDSETLLVLFIKKIGKPILQVAEVNE